MLDQPTAADLIAQFNILELFAEVATIKKSGREHVCCCPFHQEKTPSCYINESKQSYHCKGCGKGGGVVTFFMDYYQVEKGEAFRLMRSRLGLDSGDKIEAAPVRLSERGQAAAAKFANCAIEQPYFFSEYGLVTNIHYVNDEGAFVLLSAHGKATDYLSEAELRSGKLTDEGIATIGNYSGRVCVCSDYIDMLYLSQRLGDGILFAFCGHPSRLPWAVDYLPSSANIHLFESEVGLSSTYLVAARRYRWSIGYEAKRPCQRYPRQH